MNRFKVLLLVTCGLLATTSTTTGFAQTTASTTTSEFSHDDWSALLGEFVDDGQVDYTGLLAVRPRLDAYLARAAEANLAGWSEAERKAFWINMYNAHMVAIILDHWPVDSVQDIGRVIIPTMQAFRIRFRVAGALRSLDDIEHKILRATLGDARIHAAINCASISCPKLAAQAYTAVGLDAQLDAAMAAFIRDPLRNRIFENPPRLSKIFDWFSEDFERPGASVMDYIQVGLSDEEQARVSADSKPRFLDFDWSLNGH